MLRELLSPFDNKSADEIAEFLQKKSIKGKTFQSDRCPLAVYLQGQTSDDIEIDVYGDRINMSTFEEGFIDLVESYPVADDTPLYSFIVGFDHGCYPELEEGHGSQG